MSGSDNREPLSEADPDPDTDLVLDGSEVGAEAEAPDPFAQDQELAEYGENVRKRIAKEVAKRGTLERELAEAREQRDVATRIAQGVVTENKQLKAGRISGDKAILDNMLDKMVGDVELAKREFKEASVDGDPDKIADAIARLSTASTDLRRVELAKAGYRAPEEAPVQAEPKRQAPQTPPKAQEWLSRNTWYGQDVERTRIARAADVYVAAMGMNPNSEEYYNEVDKMIQERIRGATGGSQREQRSATLTLTPSARTAPVSQQPQNGKVALSPDEVAQAKRLGVSVEAYASAKRAGNVVTV